MANIPGMKLGDLLRWKMDQAVDNSITREWHERNIRRLRPYHPRSVDEKLDVIERFLFKRGWKHFRQNSEGLYTVRLYISHDRSCVCKISNGYSDFYPTWIAWCATQSNPHLPRVYVARSILNGEFFLTIMEKLTHLPEIYDRDEYAGIHFPAKFIDRCDVDFASLSAFGYGKLVKIITKAFAKFGHFTDCHDGNMMMRGDTLVITDPYSIRPRKYESVRRHSGHPVMLSRNRATNHHPSLDSWREQTD